MTALVIALGIVVVALIFWGVLILGGGVHRGE